MLCLNIQLVARTRLVKYLILFSEMEFIAFNRLFIKSNTMIEMKLKVN